MEASSSAALIFEIMWLELNKAIFQDELGDESLSLDPQQQHDSKEPDKPVRITGESAWCDDVSTAEITKPFQDNIKPPFTNAVDTIASMFGDDPAKLGMGRSTQGFPDASPGKCGHCRKAF